MSWTIQQIKEVIDEFGIDYVSYSNANHLYQLQHLDLAKEIVKLRNRVDNKTAQIKEIRKQNKRCKTCNQERR